MSRHPGRGYGGGGHGGGGSQPQVYRTKDGSVPAPNFVVKKTEDDFGTGNQLALKNLSLEPSMPQRPSFGTVGSPVTLWANYVNIIAEPALSLYRYAVSCQPDATGRKLARIIQLLLQTPELAVYEQDMVSDFKSTCISRLKLPKDDVTVVIAYRAEDEDEPRRSATSYSVRISYTNELSVDDLTRYLRATNVSASCDNKQQLIQAFNIFLNHFAKSSRDTGTIGSSRAFPLRPGAPRRNLGKGLIAIRGFFASVRPATSRILVNVNVTHAAFYGDGRLDELMFATDYLGDKLKLASFLKRVRVRTTHLPEKKNKAGKVVHRVKTIVGLATPDDGHGLPAAHRPRVPQLGAGPKLVKFWRASGPSSPGGEYISVYNFFRTTYGMTLQHPNLPVVNVGTLENPTYLPPEVCVVMPGQSANSKLDPDQTKEMIRFAVRTPADNANSIVNQGLNIIGLSSTNVLLSRFGISEARNLITVSGRVLTEPAVHYRDGEGRHKIVRVHSGSWNMSDVQVNTAGQLGKWSYVMISLPSYPDAFRPESLSDESDDNSLATAVWKFRQSLAKTGISTKDPYRGKRLLLPDSNYAGVDQLFRAAVDNELRFLLIILPAAIAPLYNCIKRYGDVRYGIATVCCVGHQFARCNIQTFANLALKFNLKLGGNNQILEPARRGIIDKGKTMVVGIDVTHPSPGSAPNAPSIAGMVASLDSQLGQWPAVLCLQSEARMEMVSGLKDMLKSRLRLWTDRDHGNHPELPENILVYRDGVSEGQYEAVLKDEVPLLRQACLEMYPAADQRKGLPRFTVVVVGKRHHTRFYASQSNQASGSANPKAGTVVDRGVTEARNWDFFLQSHAAIKGTARPAHYFVVLDEIFRSSYSPTGKPKSANAADALEALTQGLCYTYGRATKAVSVCTPAYYADLVCERARCYLSRVFEATEGTDPSQPSAATNDDLRVHPNLTNNMFYI